MSISNNTKDICHSCKLRKEEGRCPLSGYKDGWAVYAIVKSLNGIQDLTTHIPDEVFIECLRQRGYHGELKQTEIITI